MKSIRCAHIVVVPDSDHGLVLAARLRRMEVAQVTAVARLEDARRLCASGGADACLVALDDVVPDATLLMEGDAPGRGCGVPALMVVPTVTSYLRRTARRRGYLAAVPATIPPRMLYRRIGAVLQSRRAARRGRRRPSAGMPLFGLSNPAVFGKPTLH